MRSVDQRRDFRDGRRYREQDPDVLSKSLGTGMMHLNSYAVPAKIPEKEAMATLKARRDALMATESGEAIMRRARACIARFD